MGVALKLIPENTAILSEPNEGSTKWQEIQEQKLKETQSLCSLLEGRYITAVGLERHSILNLLSICYTQIQTFSQKTDCIIVESSINYDAFM